MNDVSVNLIAAPYSVQREANFEPQLFSDEWQVLLVDFSLHIMGNRSLYDEFKSVSFSQKVTILQ